VGGIISCGLTHGLMTPLDLVKCNAQTNPQMFPGAIAGIRVIYSGKAASLGFGSGLAGLAKGWAPTFVGYGAQGLCKFGFYEFFKVKQTTHTPTHRRGSKEKTEGRKEGVGDPPFELATQLRIRMRVISPLSFL
jgi:hypothetical protein